MISLFIKNLPKAELHLHIEGTFEPELMFSIAERNGIKLPYNSVEHLRKAYEFTRLQDFLDIYYQGMNVLQTERDFFDLTWAYLQRVNSQSVRHVELFFDPQGHTSRGIRFETALEGISKALNQGKNKLGISFGIIMCFLRHLDEEDALNTFRMALNYKDQIVGIGLDSSEIGNPPSKFSNVYKKAKEAGFRLVAHAGEEGPPGYIYEALDILKIERIDHGNTCMQDPALVQRLVDENMALTVCPLSNTKLCVVDDIKKHPLPAMLQAGLRVTINSDDPAYFGGYINENYMAISELLDNSKPQLAELAKNSFTAAFIPEEQCQKYISEINSYLNNCT